MKYIILSLCILFSETSLADSEQKNISALFSHNGLISYDIKQSKILWRALEGERTQTPLILNSQVFITHGSNLSALNKDTGKLDWEFKHTQQLFKPEHQHRRLFLASEDGSLHALSADTGNRIWSKKLSNGWVYPPSVLQKNLIVTGQEGTIWSIDSATGNVLWKILLDQEPIYQTIKLDETTVMVTLFDGTVIAFNGADGTEVWRQHLGTSLFNPSIDKNLLLLTDFEHTLHAISKTNGHSYWTTPLASKLIGLPLAWNNQVLAVTDEGHIYLLDRRSGDVIAQSRLPSPPTMAPQLFENKLLFFTSNRNISEPRPVWYSVEKLITAREESSL